MNSILHNYHQMRCVNDLDEIKLYGTPDTDVGRFLSIKVIKCIDR